MFSRSPPNQQPSKQVSFAEQCTGETQHAVAQQRQACARRSSSFIDFREPEPSTVFHKLLEPKLVVANQTGTADNRNCLRRQALAQLTKPTSPRLQEGNHSECPPQV
jgi:hypothetical protein